VDALPLNRVARSRSWLASPKRSGVEGRTDAAGGAATELIRRCSRVTRALRGRIDFEEALPGVHALVRHGEEGRHPRRGAPQCGAGVAVERAFALSSHGVVAGREARNHGVHRGRLVPKRATAKAPPPRRLPAARTASARAQKARAWENAGRRTDSTVHERASSPPRESGDRAVTVHGRASSEVRDSIRERALRARRETSEKGRFEALASSRWAGKRILER